MQKAFTKVKLNHPSVKIKLVTSGKIRGKALIREYKKSHIFVLPSLVEGQPLALLEAWAAKLPVIATKTAGVKEVAKHNHDTVLIKPGSVSQLIWAMSNMLNLSSSKRTQLTQNGYEQVKRNYTWDKIVNQTLNVYQNVL